MKKLPTFLFELLIVFVGVYAAFALNRYRERQHVLELQIKYAESFLSEMEYNGQLAKATKNEIDTILHQLELDIEKGNKPPLDPLHDLSFLTGTSITRSAFTGNHFEAIDRQFLFNISQGLVLFEKVQMEMERFHRSARAQLYVSEPDFYLPSGQLKAEYQWYLEDLKSISFLLGNLVQAIETGAIPGSKELIEKLKAE